MDIPKWKDCSEKLESGDSLNPLEQFIYDQETYGDLECKEFRDGLADLIKFVEESAVKPKLQMQAPVPMILYCPACGTRHIDVASKSWGNPPHRSHRCHFCSHVWRPADVPTSGVESIETKGKNDDPPAGDILGRLMFECREFVTEKKISCPETIYQTDKVIESGYEFIHKVCDIVGYYKYEENEDGE